MKRSAVVQLGTPPAQFYDGILMRANPALHEEAFELLRKVAQPGARVIDVGSGQGAFAARMRDHGYAVTSVDKNADDFRAPSVEFVCVDFDVPAQVADFKSLHSGHYDVAIGMEVIEHVENPWDYCRFLMSLVKPGGIVLLTTPNIESIGSRIEFLFTGIFSHFGKEDYLGSGHINPLTFSELHLIAEGIGAETIAAEAICRLPWLIISRRPGTVFRSVLSSLLRPFAGPRAHGDIICFILKKPSARPD